MRKIVNVAGRKRKLFIFWKTVFHRLHLIKKGKLKWKGESGPPGRKHSKKNKAQRIFIVWRSVS